MKRIHLRSLLAATAFLLLVNPNAHAQNPNHTNGDLVIFFQNPGGIQGDNMQVFGSLGNTATLFRQAYVNGQNLTNIANIQAVMTNTFGTNWANQTTLYGGLGGVWSASSGSSLRNDDPSRTIYSSSARDFVGTPGQANSTVLDFAGLTQITQAANAGVIAQNLIFEANATTQIAAVTNSTTGGSTIAGINPANGTGWANNIPAPGVQQAGSATNFGTFGPFSNVEFLWDLYRAQARNDISGQYGFGEPLLVGSFLGTVVLTANGNIHFVAAVSASSPYDTWAADYGLDPLQTTGPLAGDRASDPDGDGLINFQEYSFGSNPTIGSPAHLRASRSGTNVLLTAVQRNTDITAFELQSRPALATGSWTNSGLSTSASGDQGGVPSGYTRMVYTNAPGPIQSFFRLLATE